MISSELLVLRVVSRAVVARPSTDSTVAVVLAVGVADIFSVSVSRKHGYVKDCICMDLQEIYWYVVCIYVYWYGVQICKCSCVRLCVCVLVWSTEMQVLYACVYLCVSVWCTDTQVLIHRFVIMKMRNESEGNR